MKRLTYGAVIIAVLIIMCVISVAVLIIDSISPAGHMAETPGEEITQNADDNIIDVYDEEIPLSNADLYSDSLSPLSRFISSAIRITLATALTIFGILLIRRTLWEKQTPKRR